MTFLNLYHRLDYDVATRHFDLSPPIPYTQLSFPLLSSTASLLNIAGDGGTGVVECGASPPTGQPPPFAAVQFESSGRCVQRPFAFADQQYTGLRLEGMTLVLSSSPLNGAGDITLSAYDDDLNMLWDSRLHATGSAGPASVSYILQLMRLKNGHVLAAFAPFYPGIDGFEASKGQRFACATAAPTSVFAHYPLVFAEFDSASGTLVWGRCLTAMPGSDVDPFTAGGYGAVLGDGVVMSQAGIGLRADGGTLRVGSFSRPLKSISGSYLMYLTPP